MLHAPLVDRRDEEGEVGDARRLAGGEGDDIPWQPGPRYSDRSMPWSTRLWGSGGAISILLIAVVGATFTWHFHPARQAPASISVFNVAPPAAPPEPVRDIPPGPEKTEREAQPVLPERPAMPPPEIALPSIVQLPRAEVIPDPGPPVKETTASESKPTLPAPMETADKSSWEGQVLAALNKVKRYPRAAMSRRQQGIPYIRFVLDRDGRVISASLECSSGFAALDDEAASLPKRAQPLPKPPNHVKGDRIEMIVPVEFFMR